MDNAEINRTLVHSDIKYKKITIPSYLEFVINASEDKVRTKQLLEGSPFTEWPPGMPMVPYPELVFIGVSPGNSPAENQGPDSDESGNMIEYVSYSSEVIPKNSFFYYPDSMHYWEKLRYFAHQYFLQKNPDITEGEALSRSAHLNLGTGSAGSASPDAVEKDVVNWVSKLLNTQICPKLVVMFGLKSIIKKKASWWNHEDGLHINWNRPDRRITFPVKNKNYSYEEWRSRSGNNNTFNVVLWPNHPSRYPLTDFEIWRRSVDDYLRNSSSGSDY